ncbi:MAG: DUF169 domain-containing protein, partial [Desulfobacula sp.]|nr:DUF169 domain-containing protein [Desulfobacula sp.]
MDKLKTIYRFKKTIIEQHMIETDSRNHIQPNGVWLDKKTDNKENIMIPDPKNLIDMAQITNPLVGFYDTPLKDCFAPFVDAGHCIFSGYQGWMKGESTCLSKKTAGTFACPGAGYWNCNLATVPKETVAQHLAVEEGLKKTPELMSQWLGNQPPYKKEHEYIVLGPYQKHQ